MQVLRLGAITIEHSHGEPCGVRIGRREPHEAVVEALLEAEGIAALCRQDDEDNPAELSFEERETLRDRYGVA